MDGGDQQVELLLPSLQLLLQLLLPLLQLPKLLPVHLHGCEISLILIDVIPLVYKQEICTPAAVLLSSKSKLFLCNVEDTEEWLPDCLKTCGRGITVWMRLNHLRSNHEPTKMRRLQWDVELFFSVFSNLRWYLLSAQFKWIRKKKRVHRPVYDRLWSRCDIRWPSQASEILNVFLDIHIMAMLMVKKIRLTSADTLLEWL